MNMNTCTRAILVVLCCTALAGPAAAGTLKLEIRNGLVTLDARDVTVRDILAEWARVGRTRIENREQVGGGLVTLTLKDVPEKDALETLLRSVSGYIAAPRTTPVADGSIYDAVFVLATARPTTVAGTGAAPAQSQQFMRGGGRGGQGLIPGQVVRPNQPADDAADDALPPVMRPGYIMEQMPFQGSPGASQVQIQMSPGMMPPVQQSGQGNQAVQYPSTPGQSTTPGTPTSGAPPGSTSIPGMMAPTTPGTAPKPIKPPGLVPEP
jgi:hypothetical protein